ncbi:hypothetical protein WJX77_009321 [Trebouxia sp. C0004]
MPGKLAGLFSTTTSASQHAQQLEQPAAASKATALPDICEQLRAVSDAETVLTGLRNLGEVLRRSDAEEIRISVLRLSPRLEELSIIWETQALIRHEHISTALLHVSAQLVERVQVQSPEQLGEPSQLASQTQTVLDQYADSILAGHAKFLHQQLGSTIRYRANAMLYLLAAITSRGIPLATQVVKTLDMSLPALVNLAHPPKKKSDDTAGKSSLLRSWGDKDPLKRPSCALLVTLAQAVLRHADAHTLTTVVSSRPLMAALLHHLSVHPHAVVIETLELIARKILHTSQGLPASLQAEAFSDAALLQLAYVSEREGGGRRALDAANAAHNMLLALATHHSHGMLPALEGRGHDEIEPECEEDYQKPSTSAGQARLSRLLHKLKVTEVDRHAELLLAVAAASPAMAVDYLSSCTLNLEPKASSSKWLVGMTLVGQVVQAVKKASDPLQALVNGNHQPPQMSSPLVQAFIRQVSPPCLPRAVLSKGIQHPDALVRHTTLCTLLKVLQTLTGAFQKLQAATDKLSELYSGDPADHAPGAQHSVMFPQLLSPQHSDSAQLNSGNPTQFDALQSAGNAASVSLLQQQLQNAPFLVDASQQQQPSLLTQWTDFRLQLQQAFRARFPDPQSLLATLATLQRDSTPSAPSGAGADSAAETAPESVQLELESKLLSPAVPENHSAAAAAGLHNQELDNEDGMSAQELTTTVLFMLLKTYQSCLPEAMRDSRIDVVGLMPQGVLDLPVLQQHALLELQLVMFPSSSLLSPLVQPLVASNIHSSAASFLPVLKLLTGSASHGVRQLAGQLLTRRMIDMLGGAFEDEVALWVGLLPESPLAEVADATWMMCVDGVLGFLAEALASLGRRPQFYWGLMQSLLPSQTPAAESGRAISDPPFSLLAISAVQQALKVACSSKLPSESRTWVSAYTTAVTAQLLRIQIDPQPLCSLVIGLFQQAADSKSAGATSTAQEAAEEIEPDAAKAAEFASKYAEHAVVLSLPIEAQPLASLLGYAQDLLNRWQNHGRTWDPNPSKPLQADHSVSGTPEASRQSSKKKRKGEEVASGKVQSRKKQKSGPEAEECVLRPVAGTLQVKVQESGVASCLDVLLGQCEHQASSQARGQDNQQLLQQLLTALYQCPVSVIQQKMPFVLKLANSSSNQKPRHEAQGLVTATCRAHGLPWGCADSFGDLSEIKCGTGDDASELAILPFLLLLQSVGHGEAGGTQIQAELLSRASAKALKAFCQPYIARLTDAQHAQIRQATAAAAATCPTSAAAVEAAAAPAAAAAAARLAVFFPLHELLSLTQEALSLATSPPSPEVALLLTSSKPSRVKQLTPAKSHWVLQSGLDLADALLNLVIRSDKNGGVSRLDHPYTDLDLQGGDGSQGGATGGQEGAKDAWARIIEGLLAVALTRHGDKAFTQRADMLLLKLSAINGTKPAAAIFARCIGSCQQQLQQYLRATLQRPTAIRGNVVAQLMRHDPSLTSEFTTQFDSLNSGDKVAISAHTREATALLLPAALAHLDQMATSAEHAKPAVSKSQHGGAAVTAGVKAEISNMANIAADNVRTFYEKELMMYLTARVKSPQGFEQLSRDAFGNLHKHAVNMLRRCWEMVPADPSRSQKALHRLLPATGWLLPLLSHDGSSKGVPGSSDPTWLPLPGQQAEVAAMLLQQAVQHGSMEAQDLANFTQSCLATLTVAYKQAKLSEEAQELVDQLSACVNGFVGDCLAELPDQERGLGPFSSLAAPVRTFAAAVLKCRLGSPATIKLLRRLLAALLPDGNTDAMEAASDDDSSSPITELTNPSVSAMASHIFDRLVSHSRFVPSMLDMTHSLLPLPAAAQKLKLQSPLSSILPLVECCPVAQTGLTVKGELAELLNTLIDLQQSYPLPDPSGIPATPFHHKLHSLLPLLVSAYGATLSSPDQSLLRVLLHINSIVYHSPDHQQALQHQDQAAAAAAATVDAASKKGAAMTVDINEHADKPIGDAVGDAGHAVGNADIDSNAEIQGGGHGPITTLLHGPLATAGFTWGEAAKAAHEHGLLLNQSSSSHPSPARTSLLSQHTLVEISRCALTIIHYPEQRTLTADEPKAEPLPAAMQHLAATAEALLTGGGHRWQTPTAALQACDISASRGGQHQYAADPTAAVRDPSSHQAESSSHMTEGFSHPGVTAKEGQQSEEHVAVRHHAAGYDPVWMLLWAVKALQDKSIGTEAFISCGLLSLCLRTLAAQDSGLRALAYEALGLFLAALTAGSNQQTRQVQLLLESLKRSITQPFQQLPGVIAAFAAEAVFVLMFPGCALYPPLNKLLLKRPELNIQEIPLMYQLLVSGNQQHSEEQVWVMQLLATGLRGPLDAQLYRRRFVAELLMSLHDSPLANGHTRRLALHTFTAVPFVPAYAKDLMSRTGLQIWLDARVNTQQLQMTQ